MQLKPVSFTLFSLAILARASFSYGEDTLDTREWDEDLVERGFDIQDTLDARDTINDFLSFDARSDDATELEDFTTRELLDELTVRLLEARAPPPSAGRKAPARKGKYNSSTFKVAKKPAKQTPGAGGYTEAQNAACRAARGYDCNQRGAKIMPRPGLDSGLKPSKGLPNLDREALLAAQRKIKEQWGKTGSYKIKTPVTLRRPQQQAF
ncbi:hypothetical protein FA13DRAFT_1729997 [Coprinellus micaceus]|uniref:Uncharacterized protein n=1 Tax=Coprinellus micaceus TaxID=71717 RepID=A0A4Y7THR1_COPMI|nr:hypothetical protein FA13DRAFT_1729997 [Coprinellus micaceus]